MLILHIMHARATQCEETISIFILCVMYSTKIADALTISIFKKALVVAYLWMYMKCFLSNLAW